MNWGVLGCASIAKKSIIPALLAVTGNKLIAVASRSYTNAELFANEFDCIAIEGYDVLLSRNDIDAVYIPLPTGMHYEWVIKALNSNKHVLVEKSASATLTEAVEMVNLAKQKKLALVENFQFQYHSQHQFVFALLEKNEIGSIRNFRSSFGFPPFSVDNNIRYNNKLGGGALLDAGAYVLKATNFIMGKGFEVTAAHLTMNNEFKVDWFGGAFLVNKHTGITAQVSFGFDNYYQCNYEIWGSEGKITSTRSFTANVNFSPIIYLEKNGILQEIKLDPDNHFENIIKHFNQIVIERTFETDWDNILEQAVMIQGVKDLNTAY